MAVKPEIPIILGPTAIGKTTVGILVCEALNGEIISADSRQIYRKMSVGSAKPTTEEVSRVRHHLIDFLDPSEVFSAGEFIRRSMDAAEDIISRGKLPIVVGGAGLYIQALTEGIFEGRSADPEVRAQLEAEYDAEGSEKTLNRLREIDPNYAKIVHPNDRKKLVRALEIYIVTGMTISELSARQNDGSVKGIFCGLELPREVLYQRIERRTDIMLESGLIDEVEDLRAAGYGKELNSINSPGYIEVYDYLDGRIDYDEMVSEIKKNTRRYAKRQMTWFRRNTSIRWFDMSAGSETAAQGVIAYIKGALEKQLMC